MTDANMKARGVGGAGVYAFVLFILIFFSSLSCVPKERETLVDDYVRANTPMPEHQALVKVNYNSCQEYNPNNNPPTKSRHSVLRTCKILTVSEAVNGTWRIVSDKKMSFEDIADKYEYLRVYGIEKVGWFEATVRNEHCWYPKHPPQLPDWQRRPPISKRDLRLEPQDTWVDFLTYRNGKYFDDRAGNLPK